MKKIIVNIIDSILAGIVTFALAFGCGMLVATFLYPIVWVLS